MLFSLVVACHNIDETVLDVSFRTEALLSFRREKERTGKYPLWRNGSQRPLSALLSHVCRFRVLVRGMWVYDMCIRVLLRSIYYVLLSSTTSSTAY